MTKPLMRVNSQLTGWHDGLTGTPHPDLRGDCSNLRGECSNLRGNCTNLRGNCSGLSGECTHLRGECSDLLGDLDQIPLAARPCDLSDWVEP